METPGIPSATPPQSPANPARPSDEARARLAKIAAASPLYARQLAENEGWSAWLEKPRNLYSEFSYSSFVEEWRCFAGGTGPAEGAEAELYLERLRQWRRLMSLRIAYRSVNGLAPEKTITEELSRLAEFCLRRCWGLALRRWIAHYGEPSDDDLTRPARASVLALGKLGAEELNFSSDIDLVFIYEGEGTCRRGGQPSPHSTIEFYTRVAETTCGYLSRQTPAGFLFRVDTRLRPEGAAGPLVRSTVAMESYYALAGQIWERLALLRARPVAGDLSLGAELLESLHAFRYPRRPPPSLLFEIAAMKTRTERERAGASGLERNVKLGPGGIREIEFIVHALQLLHAGNFPFLQTHSTEAALSQLARYDLLPSKDAAFLIEAYWFLRQVEHRLQMREEAQIHELPEDDSIMGAIAVHLGFSNALSFETQLKALRARVRGLYSELFPRQTGAEDAFESWWQFFTEAAVPPSVKRQLQRWFGPWEEGANALRSFVCGSAPGILTRAQVERFQHLAERFDTLMGELSQPLVALHRLARFAERYGPRSQFLKSCADEPDFLRVLCYLFDRSTHIHDLLCRRPELFDEVLRPQILRHRKTPEALRSELCEGPSEAAAFRDWLPRYVQAEQVRYAIGELLGLWSLPDLERCLTDLADAAVGEALRRTGMENRLLVVALGKYGGEELTFGSDLDLLLVAAGPDAAAEDEGARRMLELIRGGDPLSKAFEVDLRLRPYGEAGPLVTTLAAFDRYHESAAQVWERQLLTRARIVAGPAALKGLFRQRVDRLIYHKPLPPDAEAEIWQMRLRLERERDHVVPIERAFKIAAGGMMDGEFLVQIYQLRFGASQPWLRLPHTRSMLLELGARKLIPTESAGCLLQNYDFLKRIETHLRRDQNRPVTTLPPCGRELAPLAHWLGFATAESFWIEYTQRLSATRQRVISLLAPR